MDFGEQVLADYPHLQFEPNSRQFTRYTSLVRMEPEPNVMVGREFLKTVQEEDRYNEIVGVNSPWSRLFEMNFPAYRELTLEFYCTFICRPRPGDTPEYPIYQGSDTTQAEVYFRLFGIDHFLSMEQFAVAIGLYTEAETRQPLYTEAVHKTAKGVLQL
ncbi:hypothetical protein QVD17_20659 [Tagetes erecta]|uniref:Uncharacterized protein n=1 Tax=Tagetes erecta TaxID=13708 RepID=A0AAD8KM36_TARER|nr:hypothetical protein QVD17_20659 [Tagetes erecta]